MENLERIPLCDLTLDFSSRKFKLINPQENTRLLRQRPPKRLKMQSYAEGAEESDPEENQQTQKKSKKKSPKKLLDDDPEDEDYNPNQPEEISKDTYQRKTKTEEISKLDYPIKSESKDLSDYEKMVLKNKQDAIAFLEQLKIKELKEEFAEAVNSYKPRPKPKTTKPSVSVKRARQPVRRSRRLQKFSPKTLQRRKAKVEEEEEEEETPKEDPPIPALLPFFKSETEKDQISDFSSQFQDGGGRVVQPWEDPVPLFPQMSLLKCAKVVPCRISALALHPQRALVAAGSKKGEVGFWNTESTPFVFGPHCEGVTHLSFHPHQPHQTMSCSYDGTLRCGDIHKQIFSEVWKCESCLLSFDFVSPDTLLAARKDGSVSLVDCRGKGSSCMTHRCHDNPVKCVSVHPLQSSYFLTAENKGPLCLWDLRKLQRQPVVEVLHHRRCVQSAYFSPLTGRSVLTTSTDDSICLFDSSNLGGSLTLRSSIKHNNHTGRWLSAFRATWLPRSDGAFVVGSMQQPRRIEVLDEGGRRLFHFTHPELASVTSLNALHPALPLMAGANAGGRVFVFTTPSSLD